MIIILNCILEVAIFLITSFGIEHCWNLIVPSLGGIEINFLQACGFKILFILLTTNLSIAKIDKNEEL